MISTILKFFLSSKRKRSIKEKLGVPGLHGCLQMLKQRGYRPTFVIDGGAYEGKWTLTFKEVFPSAKIIMIEAQESKSAVLTAITREYPDVLLHHCLLSDEDGRMLNFIENETASHVVLSSDSSENGRVSESLDALLERKQLPFPDFIKLDVQGFELMVLAGAEKSLKHAEFCLLEVTVLNLFDEPILLEVLTFMDKHNFQAYDIAELMRRPYDNALYQIDLLFAKKDSQFVTNRNWD
ncbi:FkbM family methyltransferase [Lacibacter cauensis]|uniref:FkbM family methyltransferase n=1 Tax=Lacibacter cauensis TaxID=510947 RepID=A0A562SJR2_9BACT|nr:FkbM family methyltransferase [Lacibacter cauensis]TWI81398.1 FkbM family methyltransferase [Lacibacter cauensis]